MQRNGTTIRVVAAALVAMGTSLGAFLVAGVHSAAAATSGDVYAWGVGSEGELGNGTTTFAQTTPVAVSLPAGVTATAIAGGGATGLAIGSNGTLYAWGFGPEGELGNGTTTAVQTTPVAVSLPAGVTATAIAAGGFAGYAIGSNGTVYAWGVGDEGELGNGTTTSPQTTPVAVSLPAGVTATAIAAGLETGYAIGSNGTVYAWGSGPDGELGNGSTTGVQTTPVAVSLPAGVTATAIAAGDETGYAIGSNGTLYAWGLGTDGLLGNGTTTSAQTTPVAVSLPAGVTATAIAGGAFAGYAIGSNGTDYAWGFGGDGELGNGTTTSAQTTPVAVSLPAGVTATAIAGGSRTGYAIGSNGTLYAWGFGTDGELGNGTTTAAQTTPVAVSLPTGGVPQALGPEPLSGNGYAVTVTPAPTTLTLSASPNPATFGSPVTFTGTLSGGLVSPNEPLGSISLGAYTDPSCHNLAFTLGVDNNVNAGNGTYTIGTTTPTAPGTYYGSAFFADSDGFNANASSGSCQPILVVNSVPTSTVVTASPNPANPGQVVTYTATVSPPPSSGTVTFADGGSTIAGCSAVPVSTAVALCHVHYASAGNHTIVATYNPGVGFLGSTSNPLGETVTFCATHFQGCNLAFANLQGANLAGFNFMGANLGFANLSGANLQGANLRNANLGLTNLSGANLQGANLSGANLGLANLTNANLKGAMTTGANFGLAKWSNTTCPDGTNSNSNVGSTCVGHL